MNRGLAAVQQQHYKSAYRYFLDAQKISPDASQVWFNLGLAASKIPGHEFRAIAWLKAYLLANPNVKNAEAIRGANARLEAAYEWRSRKVIEALEPIAKLIVDNEKPSVLFNVADTPQNRHLARMPDYIAVGGLLVAMRLYLGDRAGAEKARKAFFIEKGKIPSTSQLLRGQFVSVPAHFDRALSSAGLYDELTDSKLHWTQDDKLGHEILFAVEQDDVGPAREMTSRPDARSVAIAVACKNYEKGRLAKEPSLSGLFAGREPDNAKLFATNCSGWWLNGRDVRALLDRGRDGQQVTIKDWVVPHKTIAQFDDTAVSEFLAAFSQYLKKEQRNLRGDHIALTLNSLADLLESYRQMRGPYNR